MLGTTRELTQNIAKVQKRIAAAAARARRSPGEITLVAVSKTHDAETVAAAYATGLRIFGENRVEEAGPKARAVAELLAPASPPTWHMIGHVQSRKARDVMPWATMIQSVDSLRLARRLDRFAGEFGGNLPILLEVNVSGEDSKHGFNPRELPAAVEALAALPQLQIQGLMTMAPIVPDPELVRPVFAALRALRDGLAHQNPTMDWRHLSMGMTDDFEVAIEEGATLVRVGRAIFGERK